MFHIKAKSQTLTSFGIPSLASRAALFKFGNGERLNSSNGGGGGGSGAAAAMKRSRFAYPEGMVPPEYDFTEKPEYPEINPEIHQWNEHRRLRLKAKLDWYQQLREQPNVEAKTMQMNMPRKYGHYTYLLNEDFFDYGSQDLYKFMTRTKLVADDDGLPPDVYSAPELTEQAKYFLDKVKGPLLDALRFELDGQSRSYDNDLNLSKSAKDLKKSQSLVNQVNRVILSVLGNEVEHLKQCQVDYSPNIEAFWVSGGHQLSLSEKKQRKGNVNAKLKHKRYNGKEDDPIQRNLQYKASALLQIRSENPLQNVHESVESELCKRSEDVLDRFPYDIHDFRIFKGFKYASLIPGTWTGDGYDNSLLAYHPRHHLMHYTREESKYWAEESESSLASQAMLASFARLLCQALYYGYDQYSSLDYPFSTQTVITDGLNYSFYAYQLNTVQLSKLFLEKNDKQNLCWGTKTMTIFDEKTPNGLNEKTLETLLKFYLRNTAPISGRNAKPYIKAPLQKWDDEIQREVVFYNYRDMVSQRWYSSDQLLHRQIPEIYEWERIYKIRHPQRYMDARRRFFELPSGFPGYKPYDEPYPLINPRKIRKGLRVLQEQVATKKEQEQLEASKKAEMAKYAEEIDGS